VKAGEMCGRKAVRNGARKPYTSHESLGIGGEFHSLPASGDVHSALP
jgi:hypothetical protein